MILRLKRIVAVLLILCMQGDFIALLPGAWQSPLPQWVKLYYALAAVTYYVDDTGSDAVSCATAQSIGTPKATIQAGINCMSGGDTLHIRGGTYTAPTSNPANGTLVGNTCTVHTTISNYNSEPITVNGGWAPFYNTAKNCIKILGTGDRVFLIDGLFVSNEVFIVDQGDRNIWLENLSLTRAAGVGAIYLGRDGATGYNTVRNVRVYNSGQSGFYDHGIYVAGPFNLVEFSIFEGSACYGFQFHSSTGTSSDNIFRFNTSRNNARNAVRDGGTCGGGVVYGARNQIYGNLIYDNTSNSNGLQIHVSATDIKVYNNTIVNNHGAEAGITVHAAGVPTAIIKNNALYNNMVNFYDPVGTAIKAKNWCGGTGGTINCQLSGATPGFNDILVGDYTLVASSPLIDAGDITIGPCPAPLNCTTVANHNGLSPDIGGKETFTVLSSTTVNTSNFDVTLEAAFAPFTPTSGVAGWSMTVDSGAGPVAKTITAVVAQSPSVYRVSCSGCMNAGDVIKVSLAANTLRDTSAPSLGQPNFAVSNFTVTNILTGSGATVAVEKTRIRKWSANVTGATEDDWLSAVNQSNMVIRNDGAMLAVAWQITANGGSPPTVGFLTDYCAVNTAPCTPSIEVSDSDIVNSLRYDNTNTGQVHGAPITTTRLVNPEPTFVSGGVVASTQGYPQPPLVDNSATEIQGMYYIKAGLPNGRVVCIRPRAASGYTLVHNQTACVTIGHPVASAQ